MSDENFELANPSHVKNFYFVAYSAFLTYPHFYLKLEELLARLNIIISSIIKDFYMVRELHKDSTPH